MLRALCASLFTVLSNVEAVIKGKKVIVSRVEVDHNGHMDAREQCLATSCHLRLSLLESLMPRFLPSYPM